MPRPPLLPTVDWAALFESGSEYGVWLSRGEHPENREQMEAARASLELDAPTRAFLGALPRPVHVIGIAEDWCGDVVRHVPALQKMADAAPNLRVRYLSREQALSVFGRFLTNGGEAIPKFVFLNHHFVECGNWGPMPDVCKEIIARGKACGDASSARQRVSAFYTADPELRTVISELVRLVETASAIRP